MYPRVSLLSSATLLTVMYAYSKLGLVRRLGCLNPEKLVYPRVSLLSSVTQLTYYPRQQVHLQGPVASVDNESLALFFFLM